MKKLTAMISKEDDIYVSLCPEYDIASQGESVDNAMAMLKEAIELFLEYADETEIKQRINTPIIFKQLEIESAKTGTLRSIIRQSQLSKNLFEV